MVRITGRYATCPGCGQRRGVNTNGSIRQHRRLGMECSGAGGTAGVPAAPAVPRVVQALHPRPALRPDDPWIIADRRRMAADLAARLGSATVTVGGTITLHTPGAIVGGRRNR